MSRTLRRGTRGPDVTRWQRFLEAQGHSPGSIDGVFGPKTVEATRAFQLACELVTDAIVGPKTLARAAERGLRMARRLKNSEVTAALIDQAKRILREHHDALYGSEFPFERDGIRYFGRIEEHYHPPGGPRKPWGHHPGVSLFIEGPVDVTVEAPDDVTEPPGDGEPSPEAPPIVARGTIVLDPGHGGTERVGGSSPNNATSPSGVPEKALTLEMVKRIRDILVERSVAVRVELTRTADVNLALSDRARLAGQVEADVFLSLHFNGFDGSVRGSEAHVRPRAGGNVNHAEDRRFAERLVNATQAALAQFDTQARSRGVFDSNLGVLRDELLGVAPGGRGCRACLLEMEFLDVSAVDGLFNTGPSAPEVKQRVAEAIAEALLAELAG